MGPYNEPVLSIEGTMLNSATIAGGWETARRRSNQMDILIRELLADAKASPDSYAVLAIGGYGREELSPQSDLDILVLYSTRIGTQIDKLAKNLFYPLWDKGFHVGHSVHSLKDSLKSAAKDIDFLTASLNARLIAGSSQIFDSFCDGINRLTNVKRRKVFLVELHDKQTARYHKYGDSACLLEPNVKDSRGGLRDIQSVLWAAKVLFNTEGFSFDIDKRFLDEEDIACLVRGYEFLLLVREHLHDTTSRPMDLLSIAHQESVASSMGYEPADNLEAVDVFMSDYYTITSDVEFVTDLFWSQVKSEFMVSNLKRKGAKPVCEGINAVEGWLDFAGDTKPCLSDALRLFAYGAKTGLEISPRALREIRGLSKSHLDKFTWSESSRRDFLAIVSAGEKAVEIFETMMSTGVLGLVLPEMAAHKRRSQYGFYHRYAVDVHSFHAVCEISRICSYGYHDQEPLDILCEEVADTESLLLAGFLHDIGKGAGKKHEQVGAKAAQVIVNRMGFLQDIENTVSFLVANHMLLAQTATRRDLNDENMIFDLAASIKDGQRLKMLYILTIADGLATGPEAWTAWKAVLVRELFFKLAHIIDNGEVKKDTLSLVAGRRRELKSQLAKLYPEKRIDEFIDSMPRYYVLANDVPEIATHYGLIEKIAGGKPAFVRKCIEPGIYELVMAAPDRPGLFATVAGVLAQNGIDVHGAEVFSSNTGIALDIFKVGSSFSGDIEADKWARVEKDITMSILGKLDLDSRAPSRCRTRSRSLKPGNVEVTIDNGLSDFYTVIEVHAADYTGLLKKIAGVFHSLEVDIRSAKISTMAGRVVDVFYVRDLVGQKITDKDLCQRMFAELSAVGQNRDAT